jgi:hypothetical protein
MKHHVLSAAGVALAWWTIVVAPGCAARQPPGPDTAVAPGIAALELLGEYNIPALTPFEHLHEARFGGISGLAVDPRSGELVGVSDDRERPRVFVFRPLRFEPGSAFRVDLHAYMPLPAHPDAPAALDPEGIAITRSGRVFIASEGIQSEEPRIPPAVVEYSRNYAFVRQLAIPPKFIPTATGALTRGVRNNAAFESLTLTPDERRLYTAAESPLVQDGPVATTDAGALVRILEFEASADTYEPRREFAYPVDAMGTVDFTPRFSVVGLVELLALSDTEFLAMERGYAEADGNDPDSINRIRIFRASLAGATDISGFDSIRGRPGIVALRKTLLLDLGTVEGLSPVLARLDNFEGMAFGPTLPDGSRTLVIVSDDNFNTRQVTSFLLFRVRE